jgi:putative membrane protein insertion efficiency factor
MAEGFIAASKSMIARLLLALIWLYQRTLSPLLGNVCRFEPSCSRYAAGCIELHGVSRGTLLSIVRLCKCHPFHPGGYDPPPLPRPAPALVTCGGSAAAPPHPPQPKTGRHTRYDVTIARPPNP